MDYVLQLTNQPALIHARKNVDTSRLIDHAYSTIIYALDCGIVNF